MIMPEIPDRPWSKIAADLFEYQSQLWLRVVWGTCYMSESICGRKRFKICWSKLWSVVSDDLVNISITWHKSFHIYNGELFLNRRLKTSLPTSAQLLMPQGIDTREIQDPP
jgi:hypothetical protein